MTDESSSKTWKIGCISATAVIVAAIIGLGVPFAQRLADIYFPLATPIVNSASPTQNAVPPNQAVATTAPSSPNDCSQMIVGENHFPTLGLEWKLEAINENRIIHIWSNHWENNLPEFKYFLPAGQSISFMSGGGSLWAERPGCNGVAQVIYQRDSFREISIQEYQRYIEQKIIP